MKQCSVHNADQQRAMLRQQIHQHAYRAPTMPIDRIWRLCVVCLILSACSSRTPTDQTAKMTSPNGIYVARVPIREAVGRPFARYWHPTIADRRGRVLYRDSEGFPARFNVYWTWDQHQRFWVYNSDNGTMNAYVPKSDTFVRLTPEASHTLGPPENFAQRHLH